MAGFEGATHFTGAKTDKEFKVWVSGELETLGYYNTGSRETCFSPWPLKSEPTPVKAGPFVPPTKMLVSSKRLIISTVVLILINYLWYTTSDPTTCVVFPGLPADTGSFAYYLLARGVVYGCVLAVIVATLIYRNTFKQQPLGFWEEEQGALHVDPLGPIRSPHEGNFRLLVGLSVFASMAVTLHAMNSALRKFDIGTKSIQCALVNATPFVLGLLSAIGAHTLLISEIDPLRYVELADPDEESERSRSATVAPAKFSDYCCTKLQRATLSMSVLLAVLLVFGQQFEPPIGMAEHASNFTLADRQAAFQRSVSIDF